MVDSKNDFEIAKSLHDLLEPLPEERRQRILRWVAESLDVSLTVRHAPPTQTLPESPSKQRTQSNDVEHGTERQHHSRDIKSFYESKAPKNDVQFAAVVAYYYRFEAPHKDQTEEITADILQDSSRLVGRKRLSNPLKTLNNAKNLGYLDSAERGEFRVSTVGENLVAMTLPGNANRKTNRGVPAKTKKTGKKKAGKKNSTKKRS